MKEFLHDMAIIGFSCLTLFLREVIALIYRYTKSIPEKKRLKNKYQEKIAYHTEQMAKTETTAPHELAIYKLKEDAKKNKIKL